MSLFQSQVAEITLSYYPNIKAEDCQKISSSRDAHKLFRDNWNNAQISLVEEFKVMLLNRANQVLGISTISKGGITGTVADPKIIFGLALKAVACGMILAHNHPSGNLKPSHADIKLTQKLVSAGKLFDLPILDHLIITNDNYYSFADDCEPCLC
jgi:DNA repair protein RadC